MNEKREKILAITCVSDRSEVGLLCGLLERGHKLTIICDPRDENSEVYREAGATVYVHEVRNRLDLRSVFLVRRLLQEEKIRHVYAPTGKGASTVVLASVGMGGNTPRIVTYRGTMGHLSWYDPAARLAHLNKKVTAIICNCLAVQGYLHSLGISLEKLPCVYKGHKGEWYQSKTNHSRREFGVNEDDFLIACVANLRPVKGVPFLLEALSILQEKRLKIKLLVLGDGAGDSYQAECQRLKIDDVITFLGFRKDVPAILDLCDLHVMPSVDREGVPRSVVEASFRGVPSVVSDVGGMPEIVTDQVSGLVVPPRDSEGLARAIELLYWDREGCRMLGHHAKRWVEENLLLESYVLKMERVILGV